MNASAINQDKLDPLPSRAIHASLGRKISRWLAERALQRSIAHLDERMLKDIGYLASGPARSK
ncbi:MAG: DUF1127 domain-containing protein [Aestuariivirga sp.]